MTINPAEFLADLALHRGGVLDREAVERLRLFCEEPVPVPQPEPQGRSIIYLRIEAQAHPVNERIAAIMRQVIP